MRRKDSSITMKNGAGQTLYGIGHTIQFSDAFRTYYSEFSHQQVPKQFLTALDAPAGYTMVKGDFLKYDGKLTCVNEEELLADVRAAHEKLMKRGKGKAIVVY